MSLFIYSFVSTIFFSAICVYMSHFLCILCIIHYVFIKHFLFRVHQKMFMMLAYSRTIKKKKSNRKSNEWKQSRENRIKGNNNSQIFSELRVMAIFQCICIAFRYSSIPFDSDRVCIFFVLRYISWCIYAPGYSMLSLYTYYCVYCIVLIQYRHSKWEKLEKNPTSIHGVCTCYIR